MALEELGIEALAAPMGITVCTTQNRGSSFRGLVICKDTLWGRRRQRERNLGEGCLLTAITKEFSLLKVPCETPLITRFPHGLRRKIKFS